MAYRASSDRILFLTIIVLTLFGLVMLYSASSIVASTQYGESSHYLVRQLVYALIGFGLMLALMNLDYHWWQDERLVKILVVASLASLVLVLTQPPINGARRWVRLGGIPSIQPSEAAKLALLVFLAAYLHKNEKEIARPTRRLLPCLALIAVFGGLILIEPDLGQAICLAAIVGLLLFAAGLSWKYIGAGAALAVPAFYIWVMRVPFRWERVQTFLDPLRDPLGAGWQVSQSLTAVGSGGLFGVGLGAGKQKLFFLPEAHSDFIFAVIGEETGLLGAGLVCLGFVLLLFRGMRIALKAPDKFGYYLALGITGMIVVQAFVNLSTVLAILPAKGTALPFMSQGGSSLMINLVASGILLSISAHGEKA